MDKCFIKNVKDNIVISLFYVLGAIALVVVFIEDRFTPKEWYHE